jgi:hypothetical protein
MRYTAPPLYERKNMGQFIEGENYDYPHRLEAGDRPLPNAVVEAAGYLGSGWPRRRADYIVDIRIGDERFGLRELGKTEFGAVRYACTGPAYDEELLP